MLIHANYIKKALIYTSKPYTFNNIKEQLIPIFLLCIYFVSCSSIPKTQLHDASQKNDLGLVKSLLDSGLDPNVRDENGMTPLHVASTGDSLEIIKLLIERGADVNAKDGNSVQPGSTWSFKGTPFGFKPKHSRSTPLHFASQEGFLGAVELLIEKGADVNAKDTNDDTPLHNASVEGYLETVKFLISKGADVNAVNKISMTPLHVSTWVHRYKVVKYLLSKGANKNVKNFEGDTPFDLAKIKEDRKIMSILIKEK